MTVAVFKFLMNDSLYFEIRPSLLWTTALESWGRNVDVSSHRWFITFSGNLLYVLPVTHLHNFRTFLTKMKITLSQDSALIKNSALNYIWDSFECSVFPQLNLQRLLKGIFKISVLEISFDIWFLRKYWMPLLQISSL